MAGSVFYRHPGQHYPVGARGDGVYLYDAEGKQYLDGSGGAAVSCLGHGNERVLSAIRDQLDHLAFAHTAFFTNSPQEQLANGLAAKFGEDGAKSYFVSGGSEANEAALKLARQYWAAKGETARSLFISRHQSYHGNTLGALSLSGQPGRRAVYGPILHDWPKIDPCFGYRYQRDDETDEDYAARCASSLEEELERVGAENVIAFVAETVVGATLGAVPPVADYFRRIREICDRYDILLILDEVMCGSGRSGTYYAFEQDGVIPDIVSLAKGIGAGYQPLGAAVCRQKIYDQVVDTYGEFSHGHTYVGHPTACAAGAATQQVLEEEGLLRNVQKRGVELRSALRTAFAENPNVGDVRGRGLFIGIEFVTDRANKTPPAGALGLPAKFKKIAMDEGLICYPFGGTAGGQDGMHVLLAPPFIYESKHVDELVSKMQAIVARLEIS